jgi:hypothetical protein
LKLHAEEVRSGNIKGKMYTAFFAALPTGQFMASIVGNETEENGFGGHITKVCANKEEAITAINEAWAELERSIN